MPLDTVCCHPSVAIYPQAITGTTDHPRPSDNLAGTQLAQMYFCVELLIFLFSRCSESPILFTASPNMRPFFSIYLVFNCLPWLSKAEWLYRALSDGCCVSDLKLNCVRNKKNKELKSFIISLFVQHSTVYFSAFVF